MNLLTALVYISFEFLSVQVFDFWFDCYNSQVVVQSSRLFQLHRSRRVCTPLVAVKVVQFTAAVVVETIGFAVLSLNNARRATEPALAIAHY